MPRSDSASQLQPIFAILLNQEIPLSITTPKNQLTFQYGSWNETIQKSYEFELKLVAGFKQLEGGRETCLKEAYREQQDSLQERKREQLVKGSRINN